MKFNTNTGSLAIYSDDPKDVDVYVIKVNYEF